MSNISSNSLFHFTPKLEYLLSILKNGFQPRYCFENLSLNDSKFIRGHNIGIPMVCFCDISLGQIKNHITTYGNYGIGLKKEWGIRKKLNPVIYLNKDSYVSDPISHLLEYGLKLNANEDKKIRETAAKIVSNTTSLLFYSKAYSGEFIRNEESIENVTFYNEREWRYIAASKSKIAPKGVLSKKDMENLAKLESANNDLKYYKLSFNPDEIKYIFVENENEIHLIIEELRKIHSETYNSKILDILNSKILTTTQLKEDF